MHTADTVELKVWGLGSLSFKESLNNAGQWRDSTAEWLANNDAVPLSALGGLILQAEQTVQMSRVSILFDFKTDIQRRSVGGS